MINISEKKLLIINLILIGLELVVLILSLSEILAFDYGWERRINITLLITIILIQILFLYLIGKAVGTDNKKRLYLGQIILFLCIAVWMLITIEVHYKLN